MLQGPPSTGRLWHGWQATAARRRPPTAMRRLAPAVQGLSLSLEPGDGDSNSDSNNKTVHLSARVGFG